MTNSLYERKFEKIQAGYECTFFAKIRVKNTSTDSYIFSILKMAIIAILSAITQLLDGPFNSLSGLFKLELLSSDSYFCQVGSENFI